jgi:hypothetical protein
MVLQPVRSAVGVERGGGVVRRRAVVAEVDLEPIVVVDQVALEQVAVAGVGGEHDARPGVERHHVAHGATDGVAGDVEDAHARPVVRQRVGAAVVGADQVVLDVVAGDAGIEQDDASEIVARDQVAVRVLGAADEVAAARQRDAGDSVAAVELAGRIRAEEVAADRVAAGADDEDSLVGEAVDHQALDRRAASRDHEPGVEAGEVAVELDGEEGVGADRGGVRAGAELRVAVDEHRPRDRRQRALGLDGMRRAGGAGDVELDGVVAGARRRVAGGRVGVRRGDRLAQRHEAVHGDGVAGARDRDLGGPRRAGGESEPPGESGE